MSDRHVEKSFLFLIAVSTLLHLVVFALFHYLPQIRQEPSKEPVFLDLQQMPEPKPAPATPKKEIRRRSEQRQRVPEETAPRGDSPRDSQPKIMPSRPAREQSFNSAIRPTMPQPADRKQQQTAPGSSVPSLLKSRPQAAQQSSRPQLFLGASRLAKLEESYRRKFENDIAEGDTRFLNSEDILFGSFLRRFEGAVYGVWRYPQEAAMRGIEGITPVRITFNRGGEIVNVQQLESSGASILDDEVIRTLRAVGPVGGFPKGYDKDEFHLIAFFQYGVSKRSLR